MASQRHYRDNDGSGWIVFLIILLIVLAAAGDQVMWIFGK